MTTQARTPAEVDTELAALYGDLDNAERHRRSLLDILHRRIGDKQTDYERGPNTWQLADAEAVEIARQRVAEGRDDDPSHGIGAIGRTLEHLEVNQGLRDTVGKNISFYNEYFRQAGGWSRFFRALSADGHVHSSQECPTCHHGPVRTRFAWHPEMSGRTEAEAVQEFGRTMCTVCFPSAPADPDFDRPSRRDREAMDAKAAEKAAKQQARIDKGITADGTELRLPSGETTKTLIGAQRLLLQNLGDIAWYRAVGLLNGADRPHPTEPEWLADAEALIAAIAAKTGQDPEVIRAEAQVKADKKTARDLKG